MSSKKKNFYNELAYFVKHKPTPKHIHIIN